MPYRDLPTTKAGCIAALEAAQRKTVTTDPGAWLIAAPQYTQYLNPETPPEGNAGSLLYRLRKELGEEASALAAQTPATSALDTTRGLLRLTLSHFVQNINNAILRGTLPRETRTTRRPT